VILLENQIIITRLIMNRDKKLH